MLDQGIWVLNNSLSEIVGSLSWEYSHWSVREESIRDLGLNVLWCKVYGERHTLRNNEIR